MRQVLDDLFAHRAALDSLEHRRQGLGIGTGASLGAKLLEQLRRQPLQKIVLVPTGHFS
jgi:ribose 5-phosphate isomerase